MLNESILPAFIRVGLLACLHLVLLLMGFVSLAEAGTAKPPRAQPTSPVTVVTGREAGHVIGRWVYDSEGKLLRTTDDTGLTTQFFHDEASGALDVVDSTGQSITLLPVYDADGRLIENVASNGWSAHYLYDKDGRWIAAQFSDGGTETVEYHDQGFTMTLTLTDGAPIQFEYDSSAHLTKIVDAFGQETLFRYDASDRLVGAKGPEGQATNYSYRRADRVTPSASTGALKQRATPSVRMAATADVTLPLVSVTAQYCESSPGGCNPYQSFMYSAGYYYRVGGWWPGVGAIIRWAAAKGLTAIEIGILRAAASGKGNFGLGSATRAASDKLGKAWVGDGYKVASDGKTLVSQDGLRQYRPPSYKPNLGRVQSNFEQRFPGQQSNQWQSNGHLNIKD